MKLSPGAVGEVWWAFLRLGLTSFGGPVAHLAYFREAFVAKRQWLSEEAYADLVALCQFLPGPASSKVGMGIGLQRAGLPGVLAAWLAFTMPSAVLMVAFGYGVLTFGESLGSGWLAGLKAAAVAIVAHAVIGMARALTPDLRRAVIAAGVCAGSIAVPMPGTPVVAIALAGLIGFLWLPRVAVAAGTTGLEVRVGTRTAVGCLIAFVTVLLLLPVAAAALGLGWLELFDTFYRSGALVFGGGHVVLPVLQAELVVPGGLGGEQFLAGYGAAQAVPGPLFTFAAYLGLLTGGAAGVGAVGGAGLALIAIFLPGALLTIGVLPFWSRVRQNLTARRLLAGVNAGVVGLLAAALWSPGITHGITSVPTLIIAVAGFGAILSGRVPAWAVVIASAVLGAVLL